MDISKISRGITVFIDILGFNAEVKEAETEDDIIKIEEKLISVQEIFGFREKDEWLHASFNIKTLAFSDSIIIHYDINAAEKNNIDRFELIMSIITDLVHAQARCIMKNIFIRGGISGIGFNYYNDNILVDNKLFDAYQLEQKACYPIIAIHKSLYEEIKKSGKNNADYKTIKILKKASYSKEDFYYIEYIKVYCQECDDNEKHKWLTSHKEAIENATKNITDKKILAKYNFLIKNHNKAAKAYDFKELMMQELDQ